MHSESYEEMSQLVARHLDPASPLKILDVGSYDVNGSYRPLFTREGWTYEGADMQAGPNVDHVLTDPYRFPFPDASYGVVVSGQAFEHIQFFWRTWREMVRVLRPGGLIFLIAVISYLYIEEPQRRSAFFARLRPSKAFGGARAAE